MMNYFSSKKKWMAYLILLTFVFTCIVPTNIVGGNSEAWAADSDLGYTMELTKGEKPNPDPGLTDPAAGQMGARKYGELVDSENGIVKITLETKSTPVDTTIPVDLILIMDESGSLNMLSNEHGTAMPCLNNEHYYRIPAGYLSVYYPDNLDFSKYNKDAYITFKGSPLQNVQMTTWSAAYPANKHFEYFQNILSQAKDENNNAFWLGEDFKSLNFTGKSHMDLMNRYTETSFYKEHYSFDGTKFEKIVHTDYAYPEGEHNGQEVRIKCAWSPEFGNEYGCTDRMMESRSAAVQLADRVWGASDSSRVAYVGFTMTAESQTFAANTDGTRKANVRNAIMNTVGYYGTHYLDGLSEAKVLLTDSQKMSDERQCYIVFLSDGEANDPGYDDASQGIEISRQLLGEAIKKASDALIQEAKNIYGEDKVTIQSIGYNVADIQAYGLKAIGDGYKNCTTQDELINMFEVIWRTISNLPTGALTDTIGDEFTLIQGNDLYPISEGATITNENKTLTWEITKPEATVSFYVKLNPEKLQDVGYATYLTNADTPTETGANLEYKPLEVDLITHKIVEGSPVNIPLYSPELTVRGKSVVAGEKFWVDGGRSHDNEKEVKLTLNRFIETNGQKVEKPFDVQPTYTWNGNVYEYEKLLQYDEDGNKYIFEVVEETVWGYDEPTYDGYNITNTLKQDTFNISGTKSWSDIATNLHEDEELTIRLFRDNVEYKVTTTSALTNWEYSFNDVPKYAVGDAVNDPADADGHTFDYQVREDVPDNYVPTYTQKTVGEDLIVNILNTLVDKTRTSVKVEKEWIGGPDDTERPTIVIRLLQNGEEYQSVALTYADKDTHNYQHVFTDLPVYYQDANGNMVEYQYSVEEDAVPGYISSVSGDEENGFKIVNTLKLDNMGQLSIEKQVEGGEAAPPASQEYGFVLQVKAVEDLTLLNPTLQAEENRLMLKEKMANDDKDEADAELLKKEQAFKDAAFLTTPSQFEFVMLDDSGVGLFAADRYDAVFDLSTGSMVGYTPDKTTEPVNEEEFDNLLDEVISHIKAMFDDFIGLLQPEVFMAGLCGGDKLHVSTPSALAFGMSETSELLSAYEDTKIAQNRVESAKQELEDFQAQKGTSPSAITLIMPDGNKVRLNPDDEKYFNDEVGAYFIPFNLKDNERASFAIEATTGSVISYKVIENKYPLTNYKYTEIEVQKDTVKEDLFRGLQTSEDYKPLTTAAAYHYIFTNVYETSGGGGGGGGSSFLDRIVQKVWNDNNNPNRPSSILVNLLRNDKVFDTVELNAENNWTYPWKNLDASYIWRVEEVNVADGYVSSIERSGNTFIITNTYSTPEENIPDENVPTGSVEPGEPLDELEDPEIPLGDAPATGDTNNAAPFMALLLAAIVGLVITRRKFN